MILVLARELTFAPEPLHQTPTFPQNLLFMKDWTPALTLLLTPVLYYRAPNQTYILNRSPSEIILRLSFFSLNYFSSLNIKDNFIMTPRISLLKLRKLLSITALNLLSFSPTSLLIHIYTPKRSLITLPIQSVILFIRILSYHTIISLLLLSSTIACSLFLVSLSFLRGARPERPSCSYYCFPC